MNRVLFALALMFSTQLSASAQTMTGADFLDVCTRTNESWISFCHGYVQAIVDSVGENPIVCIPDGLSRAELVGDVVEHLVSFRVAGQIMTASTFVFSAMSELHPCL